MRTRNIAILALGLAVSMAAPACSSGGQSTNTSSSTANSAEGFEGSLATSGRYAAIWTVSKDTPADVFNSSNSVTLTSDQQTFGHINVKPDGSVSFGSTAPGLAPDIQFNGSGATVTLDKSGQFVCAFSVDADLAGASGGTPLHIKGAMKVHWYPQGIGDLSCP